MSSISADRHSIALMDDPEAVMTLCGSVVRIVRLPNLLKKRSQKRLSGSMTKSTNRVDDEYRRSILSIV